MVQVITTDEFKGWFEGLAEKDSDAVEFSVGLLEQMGVLLPHPHSTRIVGTKLAMRELRVQSGGRPLRIFYMFDPARQAVLLVGGDKTGDDRFYEREIKRAEKVWKEYLAGQ